MRNLIIWMLVLVGLFSTWYFWIREKPVETRHIFYRLGPEQGEEEIPPSRTAPYAKVKQEIKDWLEIGGKAVPIVSFLLAFWIKKRK